MVPNGLFQTKNVAKQKKQSIEAWLLTNQQPGKCKKINFTLIRITLV